MNATSRRILILAVLILKSCRTEAADEPAVAPLVTLTMNGISPFNVSDFLHDSILNTGLAESVTESIDQELIRQPYNLSPKVARLQGMSVFWSPHRPMNMVTASFHQVYRVKWSTFPNQCQILIQPTLVSKMRDRIGGSMAGTPRRISIRTRINL